MKDTLRYRLCQTNPARGALHANLEDHLERAQAAARDGVDLLVLPELSLTGYFLKDQVPEVALALDAPALARLAATTADGLALVAGHRSWERFEEGGSLGRRATIDDSPTKPSTGASAGIFSRVRTSARNALSAGASARVSTPRSPISASFRVVTRSTGKRPRQATCPSSA